MPVLFNRRWQVTVGNVDLSALDVQFDVTKSTKAEPNTCEVRIYNLSRDTRSRLEGLQTPQISLRAGYESDGDSPPLLFVGNARRLYTQREGTLDLVTTVQSSDRGRELQTARISRSYNPGTRVVTALRDALTALGVGEGNLSEFEASYATRTGSMVFADGFVADGPARRVLDTLVRAANLRWSVQNGNLQLQQSGQPLETRILRLAPGTGLIGTPTRNYSATKAAERRKIQCQTLIIPGVEPGRKVYLDSELIQGTFEVRQTVYKGNSRGAEWYANLELSPVG